MPDGVDQTKMLDGLVSNLTDHLLKAHKASSGIAENFNILIRQLDRGHSSIKSWVMETAKLPAPLKAISKALTTPVDELRQAMKTTKDALEIQRLMVREIEQRAAHAAQVGVDATKARTDLATARKDLQTVERKHWLAEAEVALHEETNKLTGKRVAIEFMVLRGAQLAVKESFELNKAILDTNSNYAKRLNIFHDILTVQTRTGASSQQMVAAAKALRGTGGLLRGDFQSTLETVIQMEQSLGVTGENAAQLARIFQVNLGVPVRRVADDITKISGQTSLAADEATRFATEIGKALRVLGPGGATQAREVTRYVTKLAASMKDVGGDAGEIVKLFSEMTKGTAQGFLIRGLSGVNNPAAIGTNQGSQLAFQGIGRIIDNIVRAAPGTRAYVAQLEAAAQVLNMSTDSVLLYKQALEASNKPLDESALLQKHWEQQITQTGESVKILEHSLGALLRRGFLPVIDYGVIPIMKGLNGIVNFISHSKIVMGAALGAVYIGLGYTIYALTRLAAALALTAATSIVAARAERARQLELGLGMVAGKGGLLATLVKLGGPLSMFSRSISLVLPVLLGPVGIAGAVVIGVVAALNHFFPNWLNPVIDKIMGYQKKDFTKTAYTSQSFGIKPLTRQDMDAIITHAIVAGGIKGGFDALRTNAWRMPGLISLQGHSMEERLRDLGEKHMPELVAKVRERIALSTVTAEAEKTARQDQEMIEATKASAKTFKEEVPKLGKAITEQREREAQRQQQEERTEKMLNKTSQPLTPDPWAKTKDQRYDRFQGFMR